MTPREQQTREQALLFFRSSPDALCTQPLLMNESAWGSIFGISSGGAHKRRCWRLRRGSYRTDIVAKGSSGLKNAAVLHKVIATAATVCNKRRNETGTKE